MSLVSSDGFILSSDNKSLVHCLVTCILNSKAAKKFHFYEVIKEFCIGLLVALGFHLPNNFHAINKDEICLIRDD